MFYYAHSFLLLELLKRKLTKHQFEVQFKVIQVFSSVDIEKHFSIEEFFHHYLSVLSNQDKNFEVAITYQNKIRIVLLK